MLRGVLSKNKGVVEKWRSVCKHYGFPWDDLFLNTVYTYMKTIQNQPNVGKYTSPMDPMGLAG